MARDEQVDIERGSPERDEKRNRGDKKRMNSHEHDEHEHEPSDDDVENEPDEYARLLKFVERESARSAKHKDADEDENDEERPRKRLWYAPWKTVELEDDHAKKVPRDWLETDPAQGLSDDEVTRRRQRFGYNELESKKESFIGKFLGYFRGPILYVMEIAVVLAAGLRDWITLGVIIAILLLNAFVGWYQEKQAGDIVEQLKAGIALKAVVIRNGNESEIEARDIVPGDVFVVEEGQTVPADGRILASYDDKDGKQAKEILNKRQPGQDQEKHDQDEEPADQGHDRRESAATAVDRRTPPKSDEHAPEETKTEGAAGNDDHPADGDDKAKEDKAAADKEEEQRRKGPSVFSVDQSAITGESLAVDKYIGDEVYYTTNAKRGKVLLVATSSAKGSFVGKTAQLVTDGGQGGTGHFQQVMNSIGYSLLILVIVWLFAVWVDGFFRHTGIATPEGNNLLAYTLVFLVIGVPVGLPCVTTTTMAVGAAYLAKKKAIVQKLTAIESLAGVDILCSDKTGTLTANKLSVHNPYAVEGVDLDWMLAVAVLASSHNIKALDPIDRVTIVALKDYPNARKILSERKWKTQKFTPFDPVSKRITAEVEDGEGKKFICAKGAPNAIIKLCNPPKDKAESAKEKSAEYAGRGFRTLGVAVQENGGQWQMLGLIPMFDPPRSDTASTVGEAGQLGVRIKMLTGDAVAIAKETCKQLALGTNVYDSARLIGGTDMAGSDMHNFVESADGFAEVTPEHKYRVVEMLQNRGHLIAMTGDGVNDAPSLKRADCGIAVEGASDAARSAADVVFLDEGLSTIITAIKVARQIFHRMKAYIVYRIALCLHLEIYLTISILVLNETIRPDLIVFIALFADLGTIAIAYDRAPFAKAPVEWQMPKIWIISTVLGLLLAGATWIIRGTLLLNNGGIIANWGSVQEILFLEVALTENWLILVTRGGGTWPSWQLIGALLGIDVLATVFCVFGWISGSDPHNGHTDIVTVVRVWAFSFAVIVIAALVYYILNRITWLDNLGKANRGRKREEYEDFVTNLRRLTIIHERLGAEEHNPGDPHSRDVYHFAQEG
ncbi:putative PMA1-H+-transporting P-type ATPase [Exidia glandulosa HHB12029]|uniref:Plasma membrane ATPase n=1 Tax=Exidia glandulosa HHB12029 TaxID=1314781 RepID=A0A165G8L5_EXIGL|nr:putative PMA1-H+-transporting P-type ATPase [Exidia glandulosa HHB12029]